MRVAKTIISQAMALLIVMGVLTVGSAPSTHAEECKGVSERTHVADDFDHKMHWYDVKMDSCATEEYLEDLNNISDAATLGSLLSLRVPEIGIAAGYVSLWSMQNRRALEECAEPGTGVTFHEVNGAIIDCKPQ